MNANEDTNNGTMMPHDMQSVQMEPQVQPQVEPNVQPQLPVQAQPNLYPVLESQLHPQFEANDEPEIMQGATEPQPQAQDADDLTLDLSLVPVPSAAPDPFPAVASAPVPPAGISTVSPEMPVGVQHDAQGFNTVSCLSSNTNSAPSSDAVSELQERGKLAASRVRLMDATIDILVSTFKNKYTLDKELEKRCAKLVNAAEFESSDRALKEDLAILANSSQWVKENLRYLEACLHEKHRNVQIAGPLVNAKHERKKEEKQMRKIEKVASKIEERAMRRDEKEARKGLKEGEGRMIEEAWRQLPLPNRQ